MEITVYTWAFYPDRLSDRDTRTSQDTGHAAIKIIDGNQTPHYFSWWPCQNRLESTVRHSLAATYGDDKYRMRRRASDESKSADGKYRFSATALDTAKMLTFLDDLHHARTTTSYLATKGQFHKSIQNCSSAVAWALWKGGCGTYASWPGYFVWHPNNLALYCRQLVQGVHGSLGAQHAEVATDMAAASATPGAMELAVYL